MFKFLSFSLFCVFINLAVLEFSMYYFVKTMRIKHSFDLKDKTTTKEKLSKYKIYDKALGWNISDQHSIVSKTNFAASPRAREYSKDFLALFGDSFTHDFKAHLLSKVLKADVYNFGVGMYGTDQAYLKFLEYFPKVRTKIVALGLIGENINRIVNTYRKFYFSWATPVTKPRFQLVKTHELYHTKDQLVLIKNPIEDVSDFEKLTSVDGLSLIGKFDYYYQKNLFWKRASFPYSKMVFSAKILRLILDIFLERFEKLGLWRDREARSIMFKIFDNFVAQAKKYNSIPIIMILPMKEDLEYMLENKKDMPYLKLILKYCETNNYYFFNAASCLADKVKSHEDISPFFDIDHLGGKAYEIIAQCFYNFLKTKKLLQEPSQ